MALFGPKKTERKPIFGGLGQNELPEAPELDSIKDAVGKMPEDDSEFPRLPQAKLNPSSNFFNEQMTEPSEFPDAPEEKTYSEPARESIYDVPSKESIKPRFKEPIFVRIEKFRESIGHLEGINKKIQELMELMDKIKQTRAKEEDEISKWEKEIIDIKEKLSAIDQKLFNKID
jgi:hypothetical protein